MLSTYILADYILIIYSEIPKPVNIWDALYGEYLPAITAANNSLTGAYI